jgi:hypothetical protein
MAKKPPYNGNAAVQAIEAHIDQYIGRITDDTTTTVVVDLSRWRTLLNTRPEVARKIEQLYTDPKVGWSSAKIMVWTSDKPSEREGAEITLTM